MRTEESPVLWLLQNEEEKGEMRRKSRVHRIDIYFEGGIDSLFTGNPLSFFAFLFSFFRYTKISARSLGRRKQASTRNNDCDVLVDLRVRRRVGVSPMYLWTSALMQDLKPGIAFGMKLAIHCGPVQLTRPPTGSADEAVMPGNLPTFGKSLAASIVPLPPRCDARAQVLGDPDSSTNPAPAH